MKLLFDYQCVKCQVSQMQKKSVVWFRAVVLDLIGSWQLLNFSTIFLKKHEGDMFVGECQLILD